MSPRHLLRRYLGKPHAITESRAVRWLGHRLHDPDLWHLGRRSVAGAVGLGFFLAFIPLPVQMVSGTLLAFLMRVNLPVTLAAVWLTNPLTAAPMFLLAFKLGVWLTGTQADISAIDFELTLSGALTAVEEIALPLMVGCVVCGLGAALLGNLAVRGLWRAYLVYRRRERRRERVTRTTPADDPR